MTHLNKWQSPNAILLAIQLVVDILQSLTVDYVILDAEEITSQSDTEMENGIENILGLSSIQSLSLVATLSMIAATFFATFGKLPGANGLFVASIAAYVISSIALLIALTQAFYDGVISAIDAGFAIFGMFLALTFGGQTLNENSFFSRLLSCLDKYKTPAPVKWDVHDCFFTYAKVIVLCISAGVVGGILATR